MQLIQDTHWHLWNIVKIQENKDWNSMMLLALFIISRVKIQENKDWNHDVFVALLFLFVLKSKKTRIEILKSRISLRRQFHVKIQENKDWNLCQRSLSGDKSQS